MNPDCRDMLSALNAANVEFLVVGPMRWRLTKDLADVMWLEEQAARDDSLPAPPAPAEE